MRNAWVRAVVLLLALVLAASPLLAAGPRVVRSEKSLFAFLWERVWSLVPSLEKGGITIDPNGAPASTPVPTEVTGGSETEGGWTIDPNG